MKISADTIEVIECFLRRYEKDYMFFTSSFYFENISQLNLRKLLVDKIIDNTEFLNEDLSAYILDLSTWFKSREDNFDELQRNYNFRYRIKKFEVVIEKLNHNLNSHKYVSKILNDLFGERIILDNVIHKEQEIKKLLDNLKEESIIYRYYYRSDGNYHAFHCYLQDTNNQLPWEFQIWDSSNAVANYLEHDRHERERKEKG